MADVTASATASWDASATKDTTSALVVTPLKSLNFQYAEGIKAFNSQKGAFDITIQGQSGATDFTLTSQIVSNTLSRTTDASTLAVGVNWNGNALNKSTPVTMIDTSNNISAGLMRWLSRPPSQAPIASALRVTSISLSTPRLLTAALPLSSKI